MTSQRDNEGPDQSASKDDEEEAKVPAETAVPVDKRVQFAAAHDGFQERAMRPRRGFIVPSTVEEIHHARQRWNDDSWQMKALKFINSDPVQKILICLLLLDVIILFTELAIDAFFPNCTLIVRDAISCCPSDGSEAHGADNNDIHRILAGGNDSHSQICEYPLVPETDYEAGCDPHKHHAAHTAHDALFWITIVILTTFELELLLLIYLLGPKKFFHHMVYVIDLFVVTMSLALELMFHAFHNELLEVLPGVLIFFRLWRFIRIGHGLVASTYEIEEHKTHQALQHIAKLEEMVQNQGLEVPERPEKLRRESSSDLSEDGSDIPKNQRLITGSL